MHPACMNLVTDFLHYSTLNVVTPLNNNDLYLGLPLRLLVTMILLCCACRQAALMLCNRKWVVPDRIVCGGRRRGGGEGVCYQEEDFHLGQLLAWYSPTTDLLIKVFHSLMHRSDVL